ncbi:hypothetical protein EOL96_05940 [Candidatus Saccharibacteria bacterium]|nr:hypothetical protein [Candidatus Saccharibacteria bacterium]
MNKLLIGGVAMLGIASVVGLSSMSASAMFGPNTEAGSEAGVLQRASDGAGQGRQASLESRAAVLGMSAEELEQALETKTMSQIADQQGLTQEAFEAKMQEAAKERWQARGLSADEIAKRLAEREQRQAANAEDHEWASGDGERFGGYGYGRNR